MKWETFRKQFIHSAYVDAKQRPKTMRALRVVASKLPANILRDQDVVVLAHRPELAGYAFDGQDFTFIVLHYIVEQLRQRQANFVVAHEFAHVILGHQSHKRDQKKRNYKKDEREADAYAAKLLGKEGDTNV